MQNLFYKAEEDRLLKTFTTMLGRTAQSYCQVTLTDSGLHIYRAPNHNGRPSSSGGENNNWGGFKICPLLIDNNALIKGHTYIIYFHAKGKTCDALSIGWTNNMGWQGGGLTPSPSNVVASGISAGFNGEKDCFYKFTINDNVYKECTSSYSSFVQGNVYPSYRDFNCSFGYSSTNADGTDLYFTNFRMYDITNEVIAQIFKNGQAKYSHFIEREQNQASINKGGEFLGFNFYEY